MASTGMKRLVYAPRAYVFVKDKNGTIHDLSRYVTAGNVTRLIDQVSSAEVTFRNPNHLFTVHVENGEVVTPVFSPMDPITIYLRRVRNRPVRVFTGYLDRTPYLQLFPGTVTIQASCTLKRLMHTYFDPALPYTMSFLTTYGWVPYNGQWVSLTGMKDWQAPGTTTPSSPSTTSAPLGVGDKNVFVIGDSIGKGMAARLTAHPHGKTIASDTRVGRPTQEGINRLLARGKSLPSTIVVCLGSNDDPADPGGFKNKVKQVLNIAGNKRHVIWVNLHGSNYLGNSLIPLNSVLEDVRSTHPNMTIVDWNSVSNKNNVTFDSHGLHTDPAGYQVLADAVLDQVDGGATTVSDANKLQPPKNVDGSLTQLLFATLKHIGNWDSNDIYIESMPEKLFDHLRDLATEFANDNKEAQSEVKDLFKTILGASSQGNPTGNSGSASTGAVQGLNNIIPTIKKIADGFGVDAAMACAVCDIETGYGNNMFTHEPYHGWYQINITTGGYPGTGPCTVAQANDLGFACSAFCKAAAAKPASVKSNIQYWAEVTQGVQNTLTTTNKGYPAQWNTAYTRAKQLLSQYGSGAASQGLPDNSSLGQPSSTNTSGGPASTATPNAGSDANRTVRGTATGSGANKPTVAEAYTKPIEGSPGLSRTDQGVDFTPPGTLVAVGNGRVTWLGSQPENALGGGGPFLIYTLTDGPLKGAHLFIAEKWTPETNIKVGTVLSKGDKIGTLNSGGSIEIGYAAGPTGNWNVLTPYGGSLDGTPMPGGKMFARLCRSLGLDTRDDPGSGPIGPDPSAPDFGGASPGGAANAGSSASDPTGQGSAAGGAFFASLDLPSMYDAVEASMLTGEKSLLNDKPLLPFIQQICSASLRHFQSLPDGRFYAFYPDYFGEMNQHPPYWKIDDIEILDGKVELTDDSLVTHMYVVGDTVNPMGGDTPFALRSVFSSGVVTIFNAFMANSVLSRDQQRKKDKQAAQRKAKKHKDTKNANIDGMGILLDRQEAAAFLDRYGARPYVEDMPIIRSPYYEMFLAYQKFLLAWSKQFSTPFTFTFMPELFPGGKVAFDNHGLQMYIEQVNHSWDYESGFTTTASLTAPSVLKGHSGILPPNMVQAIISPAKAVGE